MKNETEHRCHWRATKCVVRLAAACGALTCMVGISAPEARADTTYYYTGGPYSHIETEFTGFNCNGCRVPNPNADADAEKFGTNMTGFVTFDFDTTGVSGTFLGLSGNGFNDLTDIGLSSGVYSVDKTNFFITSSSITLTNGAITGWGLLFRGNCDFAFGPTTCVFQSVGGTPDPSCITCGSNSGSDLVQQISTFIADPRLLAAHLALGRCRPPFHLPSWVLDFPA
jgi:hypothetical protein